MRFHERFAWAKWWIYVPLPNLGFKYFDGGYGLMLPIPFVQHYDIFGNKI